MSLREAAKALIDDYDSIELEEGSYKVAWPEMEALRDALAEAPKAEPVAHMGDLKDKLLPCPFCGGRPEVTHIEENEDNPNFGGRYIECKSCGACTNLVFACGDDPAPILAEKWNTRAKHPPAREAESVVNQQLTTELSDEEIKRLWIEACDRESSNRIVYSFARDVLAARGKK